MWPLVQSAALLAIPFALVAAGPLAAQQPSAADVAAASVPFSVEIEPQEIITTDLKRLVLRDCGKIAFEVRDPIFVVAMGGTSSAAKGARLAVLSARRAILGNKSSLEIREQADTLREEIRKAVDRNVLLQGGVVVAEMAGDLRTCAVSVRPPE
jgi:hypothetical protein